MPIKWDTVASKLRLDDRQALVSRYLIDRSKDECLQLWESEADSPDSTPIEYLADLTITQPGVNPAAMMLDYLSTRRKRGAKSSYLQLQSDCEELLKGELRRVLDGRQQTMLGLLGIGSLVLDIDTGYSPIADRVMGIMARRAEGGDMPDSTLQPREERANADWSLPRDVDLRLPGVTAAEGAEGINWQHVRTALSLDEGQAILLASVLDRLQDRCAELWATTAADFGFSPLEYIVDLNIRQPDLGYDAIRRGLVGYLGATWSLGSDKTYLELQEQLERSLCHEIETFLLDRDQARRLRSLGIGSFLNIATGHREIAGRISALYAENKLKYGIDLFCQMPFEYAHIEDSGAVLPCCPSKFRLSIGNLKVDAMPVVWHSRAAEAVRESIHDKTFRFCNYHACEYLKKGRAGIEPASDLAGPAESLAEERGSVVAAAALPKIMNLSYDRGCNLACPHCRTELFNPKKDLNNVGGIHANLFSHGLDGVERLVIAGNGDVCASRFYMDFLENFDAERWPELRIKIQTNGLLFTRERWARIAKSHPAIDWISVSVDAATAQTYQINRGGDFRRLLDCLEFVSELRKAHEIELFFINFVVMANNFREIKPFIALGEQYHCDLVDFQCVENWGTFSDEAFAAVAIQKPSHPEHQAFLDYLNDPIFARPIVSMYKLLEFLPDYIGRWIGKDHVMTYHTVGEAIGQREVALRNIPAERT